MCYTIGLTPFSYFSVSSRAFDSRHVDLNRWTAKSQCVESNVVVLLLRAWIESLWYVKRSYCWGRRKRWLVRGFMGAYAPPYIEWLCCVVAPCCKQKLAHSEHLNFKRHGYRKTEGRYGQF